MRKAPYSSITFRKTLKSALKTILMNKIKLGLLSRRLIDIKGKINNG